jgi:hypothetical protein
MKNVISKCAEDDISAEEAEKLYFETLAMPLYPDEQAMIVGFLSQLYWQKGDSTSAEKALKLTEGWHLSRVTRARIRLIKAERWPMNPGECIKLANEAIRLARWISPNATCFDSLFDCWEIESKAIEVLKPYGVADKPRNNFLKRSMAIADNLAHWGREVASYPCLVNSGIIYLRIGQASLALKSMEKAEELKGLGLVTEEDFKSIGSVMLALNPPPKTGQLDKPK